MIIDIYTHILPDRFFREMSRVSPKLENIGARLRAGFAPRALAWSG